MDDRLTKRHEKNLALGGKYGTEIADSQAEMQDLINQIQANQGEMVGSLQNLKNQMQEPGRKCPRSFAQIRLQDAEL